MSFQELDELLFGEHFGALFRGFFQLSRTRVGVCGHEMCDCFAEIVGELVAGGLDELRVMILGAERAFPVMQMRKAPGLASTFAWGLVICTPLARHFSTSGFYRQEILVDAFCFVRHRNPGSHPDQLVGEPVFEGIEFTRGWFLDQNNDAVSLAGRR